MWPETIFAVPRPSFPNPVRRPITDPSVGPFTRVDIPCEWLPWIRGALFQLVQQATWEGTPAEILATQYQASSLIDLFSGLGDGDCGNQSVLIPTVDCAEDDCMACCSSFRQDGTKLQLFCNGMWTTIFDSSLGGGQPGAPQTQPAPNGGKATYCFKLLGPGMVFLPTNVSSGDTILIQNATGAVYDPEAFKWFCPTGREFLLGQCEGNFAFDVTDPLPGTPDMQLIASIGGTYYPVMNLDATDTPQPFLVPAGHLNDPVTFIVNDADRSSGTGDYTFCVEVTNNQLGSWSHTFDFTLSQFGWTTQGYPPVFTGTPWIAGQGFGSIYFSPPPNGSGIGVGSPVIPARTITRVEVFFSTDSDAAGGAREVSYNAIGTVYGALSAGTGTFDDIVTATQPGVTQLFVVISRDAMPGTANYRLSKVIVSGLGTDPF